LGPAASTSFAAFIVHMSGWVPFMPNRFASSSRGTLDDSYSAFIKPGLYLPISDHAKAKPLRLTSFWRAFESIPKAEAISSWLFPASFRESARSRLKGSASFCFPVGGSFLTNREYMKGISVQQVKKTTINGAMMKDGLNKN